VALGESGGELGWKGARGMGSAEGAGVLRCAQDDSKTNNGNDKRKNRSRSPSGMTTKKNNGKKNNGETSNRKNKQRSHRTGLNNMSLYLAAG
jgi:hypothetical protein